VAAQLSADRKIDVNGAVAPLKITRKDSTNCAGWRNTISFWLRLSRFCLLMNPIPAGTAAPMWNLTGESFNLFLRLRAFGGTQGAKPLVKKLFSLQTGACGHS
jgi:hypothetical protein